MQIIRIIIRLFKILTLCRAVAAIRIALDHSGRASMRVTERGARRIFSNWQLFTSKHKKLFAINSGITTDD